MLMSNASQHLSCGSLVEGVVQHLLSAASAAAAYAQKKRKILFISPHGSGQRFENDEVGR
jgi:ABC-type branched-subunit amino acid transport system substrate-binding protein